jgi:hypothetical protein
VLLLSVMLSHCNDSFGAAAAALVVTILMLTLLLAPSHHKLHGLLLPIV